MYKASEYPLDSNKILNNIDKSGTIYSASFHPYTHHTINKTHDVFMGTVGIIPPSLQRTENISKDIEMFTSTDRRHYIGREYAHLKDLYITGQYNALIRDILSRECNEHPLAYEYEKADFLILLDACAVYGIISQDAVFQLAKIHDIMEMKEDPYERIYNAEVSMFKKSNVFTYLRASKVEENKAIGGEEARSAINVLIGFLKEGSLRHGDERYEPFLTFAVNDANIYV